MTDREMDAAIAERLFGLNVVESHGQLVVRRTIGCSENAPEVPIWVAESIPDYATWEGMGRIIEAMEAKGWQYALDNLGHDTRAVVYSYEPSLHVLAKAFADTAPRAVRLAALRALGVSGEEDRGS